MNIAYFAGFFDADGTVGISKRVNQRKNEIFMLVVVVYNSSRVVLEKFKEFFSSGSIHIAHDYPERGWKTGYRWTICAKAANRFLTQVIPFLIVKKERAEIALGFQKLKTYKNLKVTDRDKNNGRIKKCMTIKNPFFEQCYLKMKELNQRGIKITQLPD